AALSEVKGANVIEAHDVIGVGVSEQNRIDAFDARAQRLLAKIRRGVDQDAVILKLDINGRTQAFVARIVGTANCTMTADGGHPYAGARTEHRNAERFAWHLRAGLPFRLGRFFGWRSLYGAGGGFLLVLLHGLDVAEAQLG